MNGSEIALLAAAGLAAGIVNAVAGGGTFFTFSAMIATGMPAIAANASSAVAVWPGNLSSAFAYRREIRANARHFAALALVSLVGGGVGAALLLLLDDAEFRALVPWLLLAATVLFAASPRLTGFLRARARPPGEGRTGSRWLGGLFQFGVAIYGGFFGAGMGILTLAALSISEGDDFHRINAAKVLFAVLINGMAIILFIASGVVQWPAALVVMVTCVAGGWLGVVVAKRLPVSVVRWFVVSVGSLLTLVFFLR